jgi:hypothetical protein
MPDIKALNRMEKKNDKKEKETYKGSLGSKSEKEESMSQRTALSSTSEKEEEIEKLLKAEEEAQLQATYERLEKQGMSDQGIVSPEELKKFAKEVYRGVKTKAKEFVGKAKDAIKGKPETKK